MAAPDQILHFWFGDSLTNDAALQTHVDRWFDGGADFDRSIVRDFAGDIERAGRGELDAWAESARGRLALIILMDQFARNAFRGSAKAYAFDARARELCLGGLASGADRDLAPLERHFFYLPLLHSERLPDQDRSVDCFRQLLAEASAAQRHHFAAWARLARRQRRVIRRFGRFPHRNTVLARWPTALERAFLAAVAVRTGAARALRRTRRWLTGPRQRQS